MKDPFVLRDLGVNKIYRSQQDLLKKKRMVDHYSYYVCYIIDFILFFRMYIVRIYVLFPRIGDYTVVDGFGHLSIHQNLFPSER